MTKLSTVAERRARLERARTGAELIGLRRTIPGCDQLEGYALEVGPKWVLLARLADTITIDGFHAIRLADVDQVEVKRTGAFVQRALRLRGEWPPGGGAPELDLSGRRALLRSAAAIFPLVTLHIERVDPDVCLIGVPVGETKRRLGLLGVTPTAGWEDEPSGYEFSDITRVDIGGGYERALWEVAGPPPAGSVTT